MAGRIENRLRFKAVRDYARIGKDTATGDMLGNYRGSTTGDMLKWLSVEQSKVRRILVVCVTGDTANDAVVQVYRTQTIDQAVSASGVTTVDLINIASVDKVAGMLTYKELSPVSGDTAPGEELVFRTISGLAATERYHCYVVVEPTTETPGAVAYPQRFNKSS